MRKVVLLMSVSLDGFVARPDGDLSWIFPNFDDESKTWTIESLSQTDTQIIGRVTYEEQAQHWPTSTDELAPLINGSTKIVFSSTLQTVEWENSRLATGTFAEEIAAVREQEGKNIYVPGGAKIAQSLSRLGLVDEYRLIVHPVALGNGRPLFTDHIDLKLVDSVTFPAGPVGLTYERA